MPSPTTSGRTSAFSDSLVEESLDEAVFLWRRWEDELTSLTRSLDEIWSWTEDRLHGALDGARLAGPRLADLLATGLRSDETTRVTVSAALLSGSAEPAAATVLAAAIQAADAPRLRALTRGIELQGSGPATRAAVDALIARGAEGAGALCQIKAFRRVVAGAELAVAFDSGLPDAQVSAMRAAAGLSEPHVQDWIAAGLTSPIPAVQVAAVEAGIGRGVEGAWRTAVRQARALVPSAAPFLRTIALLGNADDHELVYAALRVPVLQAPAIWALGHIGTSRAVDACIAGMQYEQLARACGEAYCWITGADLARDNLAAAEAPIETPAFENDDLDANLVPPPEAMWPLPDQNRVQQHWAQQAQRQSAVRHLCGRPASTDTLIGAIESGPMLRRPDLVFELRARTRGRYDVETRAFTHRQRQMMAAGRTALSSGGR